MVFNGRIEALIQFLSWSRTDKANQTFAGAVLSVGDTSTLSQKFTLAD
jgi:hypothetical protein